MNWRIPSELPLKTLIRGEGTFVGWLPNEHTAEDLQAVRAWYSENQHRLYWDEEAKSIKLR